MDFAFTPDQLRWHDRVQALLDAEARPKIGDYQREMATGGRWKVVAMDRVGNKAARAEIAMIKVAAPRIALKVIDDAIQAFGGAGLAEDAGLARAYAAVRALRILDGPDEVHKRAVARLEFAKYEVTGA